MEFQETTLSASQALESDSRRRFVAQTGMVTAAMALGGTGLATAATRPLAPPLSTGRALRVGLLLPDARAYPLLGAHLQAGAQAFAAQSASGAPMHITPVVYGNRLHQAKQAVEQMLATGQVDVLAGFVCANTAGQWEPLLAAHRVPLLAGDAGANALAPEARSEWVVRNSLGYWQAAWAAGRWAAKALGPRAIVAVGPADSGFDHLTAFERGFASAGGRVQATVFTRAADGTSQLDALARLVRQTRPDLVYALDSGVRADAFQHFWSRSGVAGHVPLVAGGMLAETFATRPPAPGTRVWAARPWHPQSEPDTGLAAALGTRHATPFHLLGYEMAQRMHAAAALSAPSGARGLPLAQAMAAAVLQTPRGEVRLNADSGETVAPLYLQGLHLPQALSVATLPAVSAASCKGLCEVLSSRVTGTYLTA